MSRIEPSILDAGRFTRGQPPAVQPAVASASRPATALFPIIAFVFVAYLVIGLAMPVLPLYVHQALGLSTFVVGLVSGSQFAAALLTRVWAGHFVDRCGAKPGVVVGLAGAVGSGLLYLSSLRFASQPQASLLILLLGRALLGAAESFVITGSLSWGLSLLGAHNTGRVMSWVGTALYAAFAVGAPLGTAFYAAYGFRAVAFAAAAIPLAALALVAPLRPVERQPRPHDAGQFSEVLGAVWMPGLGLALSGVGFGAVTTFVVLLFALHGWGPTWLAFTLLSVAFIAGRLFFGHLPDRIGGAKVALACIVVEAAGLAMIWLSPTFTLALIGVTLSGFGYSLVYPGFGVEAVRRAPPHRQGLAMGAYTAFLDLSLGVTGPALGLVADHAGLAAVFLVSTVVALSSAAVAVRLIRNRPAH